MNTKAGILKAYDDAASDYAAKFWDEIEPKNLDCMLLAWLAERTPASETILEIGCGPGEVTGYLHKLHGRCIGTDASPKMIENAGKYFPRARFEVQDFFHLSYPDGSMASVVAFYAIVNLTRDEIAAVFREAGRVLKSKGLFLVSFHVRGLRGKLTVNSFFGKGNRLQFNLFASREIVRILKETGFGIIDAMERMPYEGIEHPTRRGYIIAEKK